jgi:hypothetical protein
VTRQEEARQLLARLSELARDETLSEEDATEMVAGLVGALERMRENPAWQRVMAKTVRDCPDGPAGSRPGTRRRTIRIRADPRCG